MTDPIKSPTGLPRVLTRPMSWMYGIGIWIQNRRYDRGVGVTKLDRPVISIGNLSAGGTGKSPMVHWVARQLQQSGQKPVIAMRGYRAQPGMMGDEEREHREALPGIEIVAQPDRIGGLNELFASETDVDCVVLDDGFQHRKIARDLDIVLIDASSPPFKDALLPRGFLRDPESSLERADFVVITHRELVSDGEMRTLVSWLGSKVPDCPIAIASHEWGSLQVHRLFDEGESSDAEKPDDWSMETVACESMPAMRVLGMCGIGNPAGFFEQIRNLGWELVEEIELPDHHAYSCQDEMRWLINLAADSKVDAVCMTRKDWVKVRDVLPREGVRFSVVVPEVKIQYDLGADLLADRLAALHVGTEDSHIR